MPSRKGVREMTSSIRVYRLLALAALLAMLLAACGGGTTTTAPTSGAALPTTAVEQPTTAVEQPTAAVEQPTTAEQPTVAATSQPSGTLGLQPGATGTIKIGSKDFTEEFIVAEIYAQLLENAGFTVERKLNLGGTPVAHAALIAGDID